MMQPRFDRLLVATDFSACADAALDHAIALHDRLSPDTPIDVVHVWEAPMYMGAESVIVQGGLTLPEHVRKQAEEQLHAMLAARGARGQKGLRPLLRAGHPVAEIVRLASEHDLLVMGTHGRGALAQLLLGSVAERVVRSATCPVLTIRAR